MMPQEVQDQKRSQNDQISLVFYKSSVVCIRAAAATLVMTSPYFITSFWFKFPGFIKYKLLFDLLSAHFCEAKWKAVTHHRSLDGLKITGRNLVSGLGLGSSMLPEMRFHWRGSLARREGFLWREGGFRFMQEELGSTWANSRVIFGPAQVKDQPIRGEDSCCVTSSALAAFRAV